ncbi:PREDICTED: protein FAM133B-like isoform X2 [Brassica oleracea var. oleracea]|uniref:protein FAM133B-like isoform X2 n=1 Tax=Brassica oleracea var. oleracea TaxID=109376 RepID=UPI0006A745E5|nr:PREDICTED: protein FAM133B-like isoform X2 [Brassica oleracea var. oleracea]
MGKNQAYKAMQRSRVGSASAQPDEVEDGMSGMRLVWLVSRLPTPSPGKSTKEEEMKKGELEADTDKLMHEYRAQLDAERSLKLSKGRNYSSDKSHKDKKDRDSKKKRSKKRKHYSSSESSSSSDEEESRRSRSSSRRSRSSSRRSKKEKKHKSSRDKHSSKTKDDGPVPLSRFFGNLKS